MIMDSTPLEWEGIDLKLYMQARGGIIEVDRAVTIAHGVALELGNLHQRGVVHGNLSPIEVVICVGWTEIRLFTEKVFSGISHEYAAPEQFKGEAVTPATDIYSLGIAMYQMLTGCVPFEDDSDDEVVRLHEVVRKHIEDRPIFPRWFNPDIPPALEEIILKCLEKEPQKRYHDGSKLARALETLDFSRPVN